MLRIYLIAISSLVLISCNKQQGIAELPIETYYNVDFEQGYCREFVLADKDKVKFKFVARHPIERCHGLFGTMPRDTSLLMQWLEDTIAKTKQLAKRYCNTATTPYGN